MGAGTIRIPLYAQMNGGRNAKASTWTRPANTMRATEAPSFMSLASLRKHRRLRGMPPFRPVLWIGAACAGLVPYLASAEAADVLPTVTVQGACPDAEAVRALLRSLLPAGGAAAPAA